jgi:hypothetical protein
MRALVGRACAEESDQRRWWLLRSRRERPRSSRATDKRDEFAPLQVSKFHPLPLSQSGSIAD